MMNPSASTFVNILFCTDQEEGMFIHTTLNDQTARIFDTATGLSYYRHQDGHVSVVSLHGSGVHLDYFGDPAIALWAILADQATKAVRHPDSYISSDGALPTRPIVVCLCGSTRFYQVFQAVNFEETMAGKIVLSVGFYPHAQQEMHGEAVGNRHLEDELYTS
jgi:hypothetical protein